MSSCVTRVLGNCYRKVPQINLGDLCLIYVRDDLAKAGCTRPRGEGTSRRSAVFESSLLRAFVVTASSGRRVAFGSSSLRIQRGKARARFTYIVHVPRIK